MQEQESKMFLFFSDLLGRPVHDAQGILVGYLSDLKLRLDELFPEANTIVLRKKREKKANALDWRGIDRVNHDRITLKPGAWERLTPLAVGNEEILLRGDLLDKQVVDTFGAKIKRVNDIHLLSANGELRIVHVDFGLRGLLRRLGWLRTVDSVTDWLFDYRFPEKLASWKYVQPLASDPKQNLKLNVTLRKLQELHPSDIADIIEELDRSNRSSVFKMLDTETAAETLQEVDPKLQLSLIEAAPLEKASDILEEMEPDEATDLLADLPEEKKQKYIRTMEDPYREHVEELLKFKEGTAGSIMTTDFLALDCDKTIGEATAAFKTVMHPLETIAYIYVTDKEDHLLGVTTIRDLLLGEETEKLGGLMNPHVIKVETEDDFETVADIFTKYKFIAVPVVDKDNTIQGIVTLQDIVEAAADEL